MTTQQAKVKVAALDGPTLRALREARGWRRERVAVEVGVSASAIEAWEAGRRPPSALARRVLADVFDVEIGGPK